MVGAFAISFFFTLYQALFGGQQATLLFAGDAMMHKGQLESSRVKGNEYDYASCFAAVAPQVRNADFAVVNLETTLGGSPFTGYPCFCSPDTFAHALTEAGFDLFLTANNHTLDRRDKGLHRTIDQLDQRGIPHIGTYHNSAHRDSILPCIIPINGIKVGFLNYTYGTNGITVQGDAIVDYIDKDKIHEDIIRGRLAGAELMCVAMHWGDEYHLLPNATQKKLADFLIDEGVEMVIGGHPHVIQPMEMRFDSIGRKSIVIYSLGNFISDMKKKDTRGGAMATVHISRNVQGVAQVDSASYSLIFTVPGISGKAPHRLSYADDCDAAIWQSACAAFASSARAIFAKHNIEVPERYRK